MQTNSKKILPLLSELHRPSLVVGTALRAVHRISPAAHIFRVRAMDFQDSSAFSGLEKLPEKLLSLVDQGGEHMLSALSNLENEINELVDQFSFLHVSDAGNPVVPQGWDDFNSCIQSMEKLCWAIRDGARAVVALFGNAAAKALEYSGFTISRCVSAANSVSEKAGEEFVRDVLADIDCARRWYETNDVDDEAIVVRWRDGDIFGADDRQLVSTPESSAVTLDPPSNGMGASATKKEAVEISGFDVRVADDLAETAIESEFRKSHAQKTRFVDLPDAHRERTSEEEEDLAPQLRIVLNGAPDYCRVGMEMRRRNLGLAISSITSLMIGAIFNSAAVTLSVLLVSVVFACRPYRAQRSATLTHGMD